jgi:hypothetical protein
MASRQPESIAASGRVAAISAVLVHLTPRPIGGALVRRATLATVPDTAELLRSHAELRAALILAGKRIRKLNFGKRDDPVLPVLRRVLRESRIVVRAFKEK